MFPNYSLLSRIPYNVYLFNEIPVWYQDTCGDQYIKSKENVVNLLCRVLLVKTVNSVLIVEYFF